MRIRQSGRLCRVNLLAVTMMPRVSARSRKRFVARSCSGDRRRPLLHLHQSRFRRIVSNISRSSSGIRKRISAHRMWSRLLKRPKWMIGSLGIRLTMCTKSKCRLAWNRSKRPSAAPKRSGVRLVGRLQQPSLRMSKRVRITRASLQVRFDQSYAIQRQLALPLCMARCLVSLLGYGRPVAA